MITKQQACDLFKYDFKLVDKEGRKFGIAGVMDSGIFIYGPHIALDRTIQLDHIGIDYFILAHSYDRLTKEINGVVPIEKLQLVFYETGIRSIYDLYFDGSIGIEDAEFILNKLLEMHFLPSGIDQSNVKWIKD